MSFNMNFNKDFMNRFFRPVDNVVWDMMTGQIGVKNKSGILTVELGELNEEKTEALSPQVNINMFEQFGMAVPAFAQSVPVNTINLGDIIYSSNSNRVAGWVVKQSGKSYKLLKEDGTRSDWTPPKTNMLGFDSGVMVLRSLFTMLPNGQEGVGQMQNMLMPMMAMGMMGDDDGEDSFKDMMPLLLMSQMGMNGQGAGNTNMFANMMPMLMMSKMMGK
jgi:hypothetical protein